MTKFKRLKKKNAELQSLDRFGITRMGKTWTIRLGWQNKKPQFQKKVYDSDFDGDSVKAFKRAFEITQQNRSLYKSTFKHQPKTNLVKGLVLSRKTNTSGKTHYWTWQLNYKEERKAKCRTFGFWNTGEVYEMYLKAVGFALEIGTQVEIDQIDEYFLDYIQKIDNPELFERSDIAVLNSETDKTILKQRHLTPSQKSYQFSK